MAGELKFDYSRHQFESWPWMFGYQWLEIFAKVKGDGIEEAKPEILLLANWCRAYMTDPEANEFEGYSSSADWRDLHKILNICIDIARRKGAWDFMNRETRTRETGEKLGRPIP